MDAKTLIGKNNILFLCNDSAEELDVHCSNKLKIHDLSLSRYTFNNYSLFVYPDKTVIFKDDLEVILGKRPFKTNSEKIEEAKLLKNK